MIKEYYRPDSIDEALELLARIDVITVPLAGGTFLGRTSERVTALVDLQSLGLNNIQEKGNRLEIGATVTLQQLLDYDVDSVLNTVLRQEATYNIRQAATVAGALITADGRSTFATTMLALDAELNILPDEQVIGLGNYLLLRGESKSNQLVTQINIPNNVKIGYEYIARTPADLPIVCVAVSQWPSGRTRVALGGYGNIPVLALDGPESEGAVPAVRGAFHEAGDQWASAAYRSEMAGILTARCLNYIADN